MNEEKGTRKKSNSKKATQVRSTHLVPCKVTLIDNEVFETSIDKRAVGQNLFSKVCEHLNILEADYFGLSYYDSAGIKFWLNNVKKLSKQMKYGPWVFDFEIKFYSNDPSQMHEDLTRYQLCLQIRKDIVTGRLPCSFVTYALLGSYTAQSELGDYDEDEFGPGTAYVEDIQFAPKQDSELLEKISELHKTHKGQTPEEAEIHFLENAKKLAMFGMEIHQAKDAEGVDINLGVCANGLTVFKDKLAINHFVWTKILKISYRRKKFCIRIRPGEFDSFQSMISFRMSRIQLAKRLWKISVEHHSFFRFKDPAHDTSSFTFPRLGSKFRYSGRTQFQTKQLTASVDRESPYFDRVHSKRATYHGRTTKRSLDKEMYHRPSPKYDEVPHEEPTDFRSDSMDEDPYEHKSRLEKMHAVPTPLTSVGDKHEAENHTNGPPGYSREDPEKMLTQPYEETFENERNYTAEQPPASPKGILLSDKERKKKEKERTKREKEEEKKRMKEEARRRKAEEKERKAKGKKDKGKDWDQAVAIAVTTDGEEVVEDTRHIEHLRSFEEDEAETLPSQLEMSEENERAIDVSIEPLSESTPIKGSFETPVEEDKEAETLPSQLEMSEENERAIDVSIEPLSESTPIKGSFETPVEEDKENEDKADSKHDEQTDLMKTEVRELDM